MAGIAEYVFGYDEAQDRLYEKLVEWLLIRFYDNGFAVADWSHNQGPSAPGMFSGRTMSIVTIRRKMAICLTRQ